MTAGIFLVLIAAVSIEWLFLIFTKFAKWKFIQKWFTKIPSLSRRWNDARAKSLMGDSKQD